MLSGISPKRHSNLSTFNDRTRQNSGLSCVGEFEVVETDVSTATSKAIIVHSRGSGNYSTTKMLVFLGSEQVVISIS